MILIINWLVRIIINNNEFRFFYYLFILYFQIKSVIIPKRKERKKIIKGFLRCLKKKYGSCLIKSNQNLRKKYKKNKTEELVVY